MEKEFVKNYIGKGKAHKSLDIVTVTVEISELEKFQHEYKGTNYVTFEVAKLKNPDKFGRTHTVYVNNLVKKDDEPEQEQPEEKPKGKGRRKKQTAEA